MQSLKDLMSWLSRFTITTYEWQCDGPRFYVYATDEVLCALNILLHSRLNGWAIYQQYEPVFGPRLMFVYLAAYGG